jgi:hypothetical protein
MKRRDLAMVDLNMAFSCHPGKRFPTLTFCKCVDWSSTAFELDYVSTLLGKQVQTYLGSHYCVINKLFLLLPSVDPREAAVYLLNTFKGETPQL